MNTDRLKPNLETVKMTTSIRLLSLLLLASNVRGMLMDGR
ncbi:leu operon leader peptide [Providencia thailandensis]|nr:leu operon leader peptide [Providencia thailandensis]